MRRLAGYSWLLVGAALAIPAFARGDDGKKPDDTGGKFGEGETLAGDENVDDLVKQLSGTEDDRKVAEAALVAQGKNAIPALVLCLSSPKQPVDVRVDAARLLRNPSLQDDKTADLFLRIYQDVDEPREVRGEAALGLGELKYTKAIPVLIDALNDKWFKISETAREALADMGDAAVDPVIDAYTKEVASADGRDGIIYRSTWILGTIGASNQKARDFLIQGLKTPEDGGRGTGLRAHIAMALSLTQSTQAVDPLIQAYLDEKDAQVGEAMEHTLESITGQHDLPPQPFRWKAWWEIHKDEMLKPATDDGDLKLKDTLAPDDQGSK